ncbi:MAG: SpoIIE family protein phosphatase [Acidimicrobiales bacterium]|nr:SpoIIE family protein phosphatase [Acidimicrobiales bacterium]
MAEHTRERARARALTGVGDVVSDDRRLLGAVRQFSRAVPRPAPDVPVVDIELLARVAQASRTSMILTDADLDEPGPRIVWVNPAFERTSGYDAADVLGRSPRFMQGAGTDRAVLRELRRLLEQGEDFEGEAINYRADGTPFVMSWRITALRDEHGRATHYLATQDDVTELRLRPLADRQAILDLQTALMPDLPERRLGLEFASAYRPADGQLVGGDWIDVLGLDDHHTLAVVGDVTGHGAEAVATMGQMQWAIRAAAAAGLTVRRTGSTLRALAQGPGSYATAVLLNFGDDGTLRYLVAGHPPPLVVGADGDVRELRSTGPMIGLGSSAEAQTATDVLRPGETLVAFTDGLFERRSESVLDGLERLEGAVRDIVPGGGTPNDVVERLLARMVDTPDGAGGEDDVAVLVVRRPARSVITDG